MAAQPHPELPGILGPRFVVEAELGRGGMGVVLRAFDRQLGRLVAVKLAHTGERADLLAARLAREGQALGRLDHPGIVRVHDAGEHAGRAFLVCELVEGARGLGELWPELERRERVRLIRDAAQALGAAHAQGVVHRDVKPDNLLLDDRGRLRVADFGAAAIAGAERLTRSGHMVGTPFYMAPEHVMGARDLGPTADVWSLGVVLYEALTDTLPFRAENLGALAGEIARSRPASPRALDPSVPPSLERACLRCLATAPEQRFPDGTALAAALDAWLRGDAPQGQPSLWPWVLAGGLAALTAAAGVVLWPRATPSAPPSTAGPPAEDPPPPEPDEATLRAQGLSAWRDAEGPLARYVLGRELSARWPQATELDPVREALATARLAQEPLASFAGPEQESYACLAPGGALWGTVGGELVRWDLRDGRERGRLSAAPPYRDRVLALPDGGLLVEGRVPRWLDPQGAPRSLPQGTWFSAACLDAAGTHAVLVDAADALEVYDVASRRRLGRLEGPHAKPLGYAVSPDGSRAVAFVADIDDSSPLSELGRGELLIWDLPTRARLVRTPLVHRVRSARFSLDGRHVFAGSTAGVLQAFDAADGALLRDLAPPERDTDLLRERAHAGAVRGLVALPDGRLLSAAGVSPGNPYGHQLRLWNTATGELLWELRPFPEDPLNLSVDPERGLFAVGTRGGRILVYALPE
ncbi:MAG: serine/threonine-protein kinase [Planctomycetota bacterium]